MTIHRRSLLKMLSAGIGSSLVSALPAHAQAQRGSAIDSIRKSGTLRVGWAVWFPYMYIDPGTKAVTGITVEIFGAMAEALKAKLVFVEDNWATMIAGL